MKPPSRNTLQNTFVSLLLRVAGYRGVAAGLHERILRMTVFKQVDKKMVVRCRWVVAQSVFYHLYNQVSYMSLDKISPLTFSVGNTMKRVTVIVSSIIMFNTKVSPINAVGAAIAVFGTFLYSQVDLRDPKSGQNAWNYFYKIHQISTLEMYPAAIMILKPKSPSFIHIVLVNAL